MLNADTIKLDEAERTRCENWTRVMGYHLDWKRVSNYCIKSGRYLVSKARVLDVETGELVDTFTAWAGEKRLCMYRGAKDGAAMAKAACAAHAEETAA